MNKTEIIKNNFSEIEKLTNILDSISSENYLSQKITFSIKLAVEEMLTNIISFAYEDNAEHQITVIIDLIDNMLNIIIIDDGKEFNPVEYDKTYFDKPFEEREKGGLGIHLVIKHIDKIIYNRVKGKNILTMKKTIF